MLEKFDGKPVRVTMEDGDTLTGIADFCSAGMGLYTFDRNEESLRLGNTCIFRSQIRSIEVLDKKNKGEPPAPSFDAMGDWMEAPYWVLDILPRQVPKDSPGQYFAVERYFLQPRQLTDLRRKMAEILLKLNCYADMQVSLDDCTHWTLNPDPESFVQSAVELSGNAFLRAVFPGEETMIDLENGDTGLTVYHPSRIMLDTLRQLAAAAGFFVWQPGADQES